MTFTAWLVALICLNLGFLAGMVVMAQRERRYLREHYPHHYRIRSAKWADE